MNENGMLRNKKILTLLLTKESAEHVEDLNTSLELFIFLIRYSFLLTNTPAENIFSKRQFSTHGELFSQNSNGARYLDPKYSRWINTDPALSDFISENSNSLSGGIYNPTNLNLYHYGNNNPIKYVDPDGRDWLCRTVDGVQEYFYRGDIKTTAHAKRAYGKSAFVLFDGYEFNGFRFFNGNGNAYMTDRSGNRINRTKPIQGKDFDIFPGSATREGVNPDTLHNNYFGTSYTGPHNPKGYDDKENFDYLPRNPSEFFSIIHDKRYGAKQVSGIEGALFALSVKEADLDLSYFNCLNMYADVGIIDKLRSAGTSVAFGLIGTEKYMIDAFCDYTTENAIKYLKMYYFVADELQKFDQGGGHGF